MLHVRWALLCLLTACKGGGSAASDVRPSTADASSAAPPIAAASTAAEGTLPPPPAPPVSISPPSFDAGEPIALYDDDRTLWVSYAGGMQRPCGKTRLVGPPSGRYSVDLARGTVTLEITSPCDGAITRRGRLGKDGRAKLKELVAAMGAPSGKSATVDGPGFTVTIARADGHVANQGGRGFGDYLHDDNAADIADYLAGCLGR